MKENYIIVKGITEEKVTEAVQEFINLYAVNKNPIATSCSVFKALDEYIILGLENFDFFHFSYLVNFINYPIETHYLGKSPSVTGYFYPETEQEQYLFSSEEVVQVYNLGTIEEPDSVIVSTEKNKHFFFSFGGTTSLCNDQFDSFSKHFLNKEKLKPVANVSISPYLLIRNQRPWWKFW